MNDTPKTAPPDERQWLTFHERAIPPGRLTRTWLVEGSGGPLDIIGRVLWSGAWRKYVYVTIEHSVVLAPSCMRQLAAFCDAETAHHLAERKAGRDPLASSVVHP